MELEEVKREVYYYTGKTCSDQEAKEIKWYIDNGANLEEVISSYYGGD